MEQLELSDHCVANANHPVTNGEGHNECRHPKLGHPDQTVQIAVVRSLMIFVECFDSKGLTKRKITKKSRKKVIDE